VFDHEPFEIFGSRVEALVLTKWPSAIDKDISVQQMSGGHSNRVVGFTVQDGNGGSKNNTSYAYHDPNSLN
jgi:hypothetical protein